MTENTDTGDEILNNPLPPEPEKAADNNAPITITNKENETMEAHPHVHHHKKKIGKPISGSF